jgi:hypothetical protein
LTLTIILFTILLSIKEVIRMAAKISLWKKLVWAAVVGAFSTSPALSENQQSTGNINELVPNQYDPHFLLVENDSDRDFLSDLEEISLGYDDEDRDMNLNQQPDGLEVGRHYHGLIENLPWWDLISPEPNGIYKIDHGMDGLEHCEVCGTRVDMGYVQIVNPLTGEDLVAHYISLHYMSHGSFSYAGEYHEGRVDVVALSNVLHDAHLSTVVNDTDEDYLNDLEEADIGYDQQAPDEDGNWVRDGADLAKNMAEEIDRLPVGFLPDQVYKTLHYQYGIEFCEVCGEEVNMGYEEIHNPMLGQSIQVDCIALHAMGHESFDYDGTIHEGRVHLAALKEILEGE